MEQGRIRIITGAPGTRKTITISRLAEESDLLKSIHMHTDDFYHYWSKGAIPPHLLESREQDVMSWKRFLRKQNVMPGEVMMYLWMGLPAPDISIRKRETQPRKRGEKQ